MTDEVGADTTTSMVKEQDIQPQTFITNRETAERQFAQVKQILPMRRALAGVRGLEFAKTTRQYFSLFDVIKNPLGHTKDLSQDSSSAEGNTEEDLNNQEVNASSILSEYEDGSEVTLSLRELVDSFGHDFGAIILPAGYKLDKSPFAKFFTKTRRIGDMKGRSGMIELGGADLAITRVKFEDIDYMDKLDVIRSTMIDGASLVAEYAGRREEISNTVDFMMYLSVLNYLKTHSLTLFHQLTLRERTSGNLNQDPAYNLQRESAVDLMRSFTRMYYQAMVGADYDEDFNLTDVVAKAEGLHDYVGEQMNEIVGPEEDSEAYRKKKKEIGMTFKTPEASDPLAIALGSFEAVRKNPSSDVIVGIPSGGTESAVVIGLMHELLQGREVPVVFLPISLHSYMPTMSTEEWAKYLAESGVDFSEKNVLITDDNSSTGKTVEIASKSILINGAKSVALHVIDIDPKLIEDSGGGSKVKKPGDEAYFDISRSPSTLGVVKIEGGEYARIRALREKLTAALSGISKLALKKR